MHRYFFNVLDAVAAPDEEGSDLPDIRHAREAAVQMMGEMLKDNPREFVNQERWQLEVLNSDGLPLFSVAVFLREGGAFTYV